MPGLCGIDCIPAGGSQLRPPNLEAGRRHRFILAEGSDGLAARRMPEQAAMPGGFFCGLRFQLFHVRLRVLELGVDCAASKNRKIQRR